MADWNTPQLTDTYVNFLAYLKARDDDAAKLFDGTGTNVPVGTVRWSSANRRFEKWNGTAWGALASAYAIHADTAGDAATVGGNAPSAMLNYNLIPKLTRMVFYQQSAPNGWTKVTTHNDKALRVVSGSGGGSGGTHALSTPPSTSHYHTGPSHQHAGPSHTHGYTQVINHTHGVTINDPGHFHTSPDGSIQNIGGAHQFAGAGGDGWSPVSSMNTDSKATGISASTQSPAGGVTSGTTDPGGTGQTGFSGTGNTSDTGPTAFKPQYIDVIIASKN